VDRTDPPQIEAVIAPAGGPPPVTLEDVARSSLMLAEMRSVTGQTLVTDNGQLMY